MFCERFNRIIQDLRESRYSEEWFFKWSCSTPANIHSSVDIKLSLSSRFCCNFCWCSCSLSCHPEPEDVNCSPPQHSVSNALAGIHMEMKTAAQSHAGSFCRVISSLVRRNLSCRTCAVMKEWWTAPSTLSLRRWLRSTLKPSVSSEHSVYL